MFCKSVQGFEAWLACVYISRTKNSGPAACGLSNVSPSVRSLIFLKVQLLKVWISQSIVFVVIFKIKLKRSLNKIK